MRRFAALSVLVLTGMFTFVATASAGQVVVPRGEPVQIAVALPLTNPRLAPLAQGALNAVQLAVEKHRLIRGFPIQLNVFDDPCFPLASRAIAAEIVANPQNVAVIGHFCSPGYAAALPVYESADVVTISGSATNPFLPLAGPNVFNSVVVKFPESETWGPQVEMLPSDIFFREHTYAHEYGSPAPLFADFYDDAASVLFDQIADTATLDGGNLVVDRTALAQAVRSTTAFKGFTCDVTIGSDGFRVDDPASLAKCASTGNGH